MAKVYDRIANKSEVGTRDLAACLLALGVPITEHAVETECGRIGGEAPGEGLSKACFLDAGVALYAERSGSGVETRQVIEEGASRARAVTAAAGARMERRPSRQRRKHTLSNSVPATRVHSPSERGETKFALSFPKDVLGTHMSAIGGKAKRQREELVALRAEAREITRLRALASPPPGDVLSQSAQSAPLPPAPSPPSTHRAFSGSLKQTASPASTVITAFSASKASITKPAASTSAVSSAGGDAGLGQGRQQEGGGGGGGGAGEGGGGGVLGSVLRMSQGEGGGGEGRGGRGNKSPKWQETVLDGDRTSSSSRPFSRGDRPMSRGGEGSSRGSSRPSSRQTPMPSAVEIEEVAEEVGRAGGGVPISEGRGVVGGGGATVGRVMGRKPF